MENNRPLSRLRDDYRSFLEKMLQATRNDMEKQVHDTVMALVPGDFQDENENLESRAELLEDYLHEVNAFYYRTFHERLFPWYLEQIGREVAEIYGVRRRSELLREDMVNNLIRYVQLSNRLKRLEQVLEGIEQDIGERLAALNTGRVEVSHDVSLALRELQGELADLEGWFRHLQELLSDSDWLDRLENDRNFRYLVTRWLVESGDKMDARARDAVNRWLARLARTADRLQELLEEDRGLDSGERRKRWEAVTRDLTAVPEDLPGFIADFAREGMNFCLHCLIEKGDLFLQVEAVQEGPSHGFLQAIQELRTYLSRLLPALERTVNIKERLPHPEMAGGLWLVDVKPDEVEGVARLLREFTRELEAGIEKVARHRNQSPQDLQRTVGDTVCRYERELRKRLDCPGFRCTGPLAVKVFRTLDRLDVFAVKLRYFQDRLDASLQEIGRYRGLMELLRRQRESFAKLRGDLEALLSSRTLHRIWKDLPVEVRRYPLAVGERLPEECLHLLSQGPVERRLVPEEEHLLVLEEEGDIFRVEVDGLTRWEVPYMVVGMKE